jgi:outer membrane protein OmpA-like peptidoglycan-associated protein
MSSARQSTTTGVVGSGTGTEQSITRRDDSKRGTATDGDRTRSQAQRLLTSSTQYDVKAEYRARVETHARGCRANPKGRLTIEGNTDERGSRSTTWRSASDAESVTTLMLLMGRQARADRGGQLRKEKPRAGGHDEGAWAEKRAQRLRGDVVTLAMQSTWCDAA